jgi:MerR family redox-sensitive transcriptional activator SoxR
MQDALTIGELSARSGVAPSALRYYERLGLIWATRTGGNQRRYERAMLRRVAFIRVSAQVGVPLEEIRAALDSLPSGRTPNKADWARLSRSWNGSATSSTAVSAAAACR